MLLCTRDHLNRTVGGSTASILSRFHGDWLANFSAVFACTLSPVGGEIRVLTLCLGPSPQGRTLVGTCAEQAAGNVPATLVSHYVQQSGTLVPLSSGPPPTVRLGPDKFHFSAELDADGYVPSLPSTRGESDAAPGSQATVSSTWTVPLTFSVRDLRIAVEQRALAYYVAFSPILFVHTVGRTSCRSFGADVGHIEFLKAAREQGSYVVVGVHEDEVVNRTKGSNHPIMALHERVLGILSCRVRCR
jgi:cytidyltransferase-like protein